MKLPQVDRPRPIDVPKSLLDDADSLTGALQTLAERYPEFRCLTIVDRKGRDHFIYSVDSDDGDDWRFVYHRKLGAAAEEDDVAPTRTQRGPRATIRHSNPSTAWVTAPAHRLS